MVEGGGIHPGMVYMPMGPHAQQQWPMMNPWMGMVPYYHLPPGQPALQACLTTILHTEPTLSSCVACLCAGIRT